MRPIFGLALLLGVPGVVGLPIEFHPPGEITAKHLDAMTAEWILLVFDDGARSDFLLESKEDAVLVNRTLVHAATVRYEENNARVPGQGNTSTQSLAGPFAFDGRFAGEKAGSLLIEGSGLRLELSAVEATIHTKAAGQTLDAFSRLSDRDRDLYDRFQSPGSADVVATLEPPSDVQTQFQLTAESVTAVTWYDAQLACSAGESCPHGGGPAVIQAEPVPGYSLATERHSYETLQGEFWVDAKGVFDYAVMGSRNLTIGIIGDVRLPLATGDVPNCDGCTIPDGQTLWVSGNITLDSMVTTSRGTVGSDLGGSVEHARIDESIVDPEDLLLGGKVALSAVAITGLLLALKSVLASLFSRSTDDLLLNARRRRIYEFVVANPGVHFRQVVRAAGVPAGAGRHHVNRLLADGLLTARRQGANMLLFENHGKYNDSWQSHVAFRDPNHRQIMVWLGRNPDSTQKAILDDFHGRFGWNRSTTQKRLDRLESLGAVMTRTHGRYKLYRAIHVPPDTPTNVEGILPVQTTV